LTLHVATRKIPANDAARALLDKALVTTDGVILEGRNRVSRLRTEHLRDSELVASLENVCKDLRSDPDIQCHVNRVRGAAQLHDNVADEVFI